MVNFRGLSQIRDMPQGWDRPRQVDHGPTRPMVKFRGSSQLRDVSQTWDDPLNWAMGRVGP